MGFLVENLGFLVENLGFLVAFSISRAALWRCRTEGVDAPAQVKRGQHRSESVSESVSTSACASGDTGLGVEVTVAKRTPRTRIVYTSFLSGENLIKCHSPSER